MKDTHRWTKSRKLMIAVDCILCLTIIVSAMLIVIDKSRIKNGVIYDGKDIPTTTTTAATEKTTKKAAGTVSARLMFAGDNVVHRGIFREANDRADGDGYDFSYAYDGIRDIISLSDLAFINQETVMDTDSEISSYPLFNSPPEVLDELIDIGFDVFNQSNNHILDMDTDGARNDIQLFNSKKATLTGLYETEDELLKAHTVDVNGIKFAFAGVTYSFGENEPYEDSDIGLLCLTDERYSEEETNQRLETMLSNAKKESDVVCVSVHFNDSDSTEPSETQQEIVKKLLDCGADIIIGTGPQVLQPIEYMKNSDGEQALVMWSLGTLISCHDTPDYLLGGIADVVVKKDNATNKITIESAQLIPTITHYGEEISDVRIIPFCDYTVELANGHGIEEENFYEYIDNYYSEMYGNKLEKDYR